MQSRDLERVRELDPSRGFRHFANGLIMLSATVVLGWSGWMAWEGDWRMCAFGVLGALGLVGVREIITQHEHTIVRIYGPLGRLRYFFEDAFRDKYLQYFNETDTDGRPMPRIVRDYTYQIAKGEKAVSSFGTKLDPHDPQATPAVRVLHRNFGALEREDRDPDAAFEVVVGEKREGVRPFRVRSVLNISAMSFGSLNENACRALGAGAKGVAYVNTGEGGYGPHGEAGADVVFQIGTGKFGVGRVEGGGMNERRLLDESLLLDLIRANDNIGMVQLKISQGAKPGLGGQLPGEKVTFEIAEVRKIPMGKTVISPAKHAELEANSPKDAIAKLMDWTARLRSLTERPIGLKLCIGHLDEIELLVQAMAATGEGPDAIQLDGFDGGTGAAPNLWANYVGHGVALESLAYLDERLKAAKIRDRVVLSASGRLFTPVHALSAFAMGADYINGARGPMLALGCIQSLRCHTNACPTGIATNDPWRKRALHVGNKAARVYRYLTTFHDDTLALARATGHSDPRDVTRNDLRCVVPPGDLKAVWDREARHLDVV